jgi:two-component system sensor histidine kinase BaeS
VTGTTLRTRRDVSALAQLVENVQRRPVPDLRSLGVLRVDAVPTVNLTLVRRIPGSDPEQSQLYVMQRSFDPETSFLHVMQSDMLRLALIALVAALLTGWWFSDQILRPLHALVRGARAMEDGDYTHPLEVLHRDEIGYLVERFVAMRHRERAYVDSLEHVTRLKSDFISVASYELRTPISGLASYRDLFADGTFGPVSPKQAEALGQMRQFIARLASVADDATLVAQVQGERLQLDLAACEVEPMARLAVAVAKAQGTGRPVNVTLDCAPIEATVEADEKALSQAITHLVRTALHFAPDGGDVVVRLSADDRRLRIEVRNPGDGIPAQRLDALLDRGEAAETPPREGQASAYDFKAAGLGLGVAIARSVAEAHGGSLTAARTDGEGSAFVLEVPAARAPEERAAA